MFLSLPFPGRKRWGKAMIHIYDIISSETKHFETANGIRWIERTNNCMFFSKSDVKIAFLVLLRVVSKWLPVND
jgi:hypothetical protein